MAGRRCLQWVEILKVEGLGFVKPLWRTVVASGGSKFSKIEDLGFFKSLWRIVIALGGRNPQQFKIFDFSSLYGGSSLPPAARNPQKMKVLDFVSLYGGPSMPPAVEILKMEDLGFFKPVSRGVVASSGPKSSTRDVGSSVI